MKNLHDNRLSRENRENRETCKQLTERKGGAA